MSNRLHYLMSPETRAAWQSECETRRQELELTAGQKLALLKVWRSDLSREIVTMLERGTARASAEDFSTLVNRGLALRKPGSKYLIITYTGKLKADAMAKEIAREIGLHFFTTGHDQLHNFIACTCGFTHRFTASWAHVKSANANWMARHLQDVGEKRATVVAGDTTVPAPEEKSAYQEIPFQ